MGVILRYGLFASLVVTVAVAAIVAGVHAGAVAASAVWALALGAITAVLIRLFRRLR